MTAPEPLPQVPSGPLAEAPRPLYIDHPDRHALLTDTLAASGVELGDHDRKIAYWLAGWDSSTVLVLTVASWIRRAAEAQLAAELEATDSAVDALTTAVRDARAEAVREAANALAALGPADSLTVTEDVPGLTPVMRKRIAQGRPATLGVPCTACDGEDRVTPHLESLAEGGAS